MPTKPAFRVLAGDHLIAGNRVGEGPKRLARLFEWRCLDAPLGAALLAARAISTSGVATPWTPLKIEPGGARSARRRG